MKFVSYYVQIAWNKHRRVIVMRLGVAQAEDYDLVCTYTRGNIELIHTYSLRNGELCP